MDNFLRQISFSVQNKNGLNLADMLALNQHRQLSAVLSLERAEDLSSRMLYPPWSDMLCSHLKVRVQLNEQLFPEAFSHQLTLAQIFVKWMSNQKEECWFIPVLSVICRDLRLLAAKAERALSADRLSGRAVSQRRNAHAGGDDFGGSSGGREDSFEKVADLLMNCFRVCASDTKAASEVSKKWGMIYVANQLFKIYFTIDKLQLCQPLIRAIEATSMKEEWSKSQLVTYRYYLGRSQMYAGDHVNAAANLLWAFSNCASSSPRNKRRILLYLVPLRMLLGVMPREDLLRAYGLDQFVDLVRAVREGNLRAYRELLEREEESFVEAGIFLLLEQLRALVLRNLFKRVFLIMQSFQISIEVFTAALELMGEEDVDANETICLLSVLISDNKLKGYISYKHGKLVLSKQSAFPRLMA